MKKYFPIILPFAVAKLAIQCLGNRNYGFHRDELLHLSVSEHLAWGYMEFPPLIGVLGKLSYWLFDYSLVGVRLLPTLAGICILILCCLIAVEFGGKSKAVFLAGVGILAFLPFYRNHTLFQPVAFDQLFWTLGFYFLVKFINSNQRRFLVLLGITLGLGLMTKYTILVWALGIFVGLFFHEKGKIFGNKWLYLSALIALLIFSPNLMWQIQNDLPAIKHLQALSSTQLEQRSFFAFILDQLEITPPFLMFLCGLLALIFSKILKKYRSIGVASLIVFLLMWFLNEKTYYVFALYPVVFSAAAVIIANSVKRRLVFFLIGASILLPMVYFIPQLTPILPIDRFVEFYGLEEKQGRVELTGDYTDMFGWEEQVKLVDSVYRSLPEEERVNCVLWAENYGERAPLKFWERSIIYRIQYVDMAASGHGAMEIKMQMFGLV